MNLQHKHSLTTAVAAVVLAFLIPSCRTGKSLSEENILEKAKEAFTLIPDHKKVSEQAKEGMTADLYEALAAAWDAPRPSDGTIGDEEFLYYFITGNDPSDRQVVQSAELVSADNGTYVVNVKYLEYWGDTPAKQLSDIQLVLTADHGDLLLDDFGDGVKDRCRKYLKERN